MKPNPVTGSYTVHLPKSASTGKFLTQDEIENRPKGVIKVMNNVEISKERLAELERAEETLNALEAGREAGYSLCGDEPYKILKHLIERAEELKKEYDV